MQQIRWSIKTKLNVGIGAAVLFFLLLLLGITYGILKDNALKSTAEFTLSVLDGTDKQVSAFFRELESVTRAVSRFPSVRQVEEERMREEFLSVVGSRREMLRAIYLGTREGRMLEWGYGPGFVNNAPLFPEGYDPRERPWYKTAVDKGGYGISEPYLYASVEAMGITAVIPVQDREGNFLGVLGVDVMLSDLRKIIEAMDFQPDSRVALFTGQNVAIVNQFGPPGEDPGEELISHIEDNESGSLVTIGDERYFTGFKRNQASGWTLVLSLPYKSIMAQPNASLRMIIFFDIMLMLLLFVVLGVISNQLLLNPILLIVKGIRAWEAGESDFRVSIGSDDEIDLLARELNGLAERVGDYSLRMEEKVQRRTLHIAQLQQENLRLRIIEEKERIYSYLHDSLGAKLTNIFLSNSVAMATLDKRGDIALVKDMHQRIEDNTQLAIDDLKEIVTGSDPSAKRMIDFRRLVEQNLRQRLEICDIDFHCTINDPDLFNKLSRQVRFDLENVLQELVSNVLKHSGADRVELTLNVAEDVVKLYFHDNGKGFNPDQADAGGFGVKHMMARLNAKGGRCSFDSSPGKGTTVSLTLGAKE